MAFLFGKGTKEQNQRKEKVKSFINFTQASEEDAMNYLKKKDWNLDQAVDEYFNHPPANKKKSTAKVDTKGLEKLFDQYKDPNSDVLEDENLEKFMEDCGINPKNVESLVFNWRLNAQNLGELTRTEFVDGLANLRWDSVQKIKEGVPVLRRYVDDEKSFKLFYEYLFQLCKPSKEVKVLEIDMAVEIWKMVLEKKFPMLEAWIEFIEEKKIRGINRDNWNLILEFAASAKSDFANYDNEAAWPTLFDEFVEWYREEKLGEKRDD